MLVPWWIAAIQWCGAWRKWIESGMDSRNRLKHLKTGSCWSKVNDNAKEPIINGGWKWTRNNRILLYFRENLNMNIGFMRDASLALSNLCCMSCVFVLQ